MTSGEKYYCVPFQLDLRITFKLELFSCIWMAFELGNTPGSACKQTTINQYNSQKCIDNTDKSDMLKDKTAEKWL